MAREWKRKKENILNHGNYDTICHFNDTEQYNRETNVTFSIQITDPNEILYKVRMCDD